MKIRFSFNFRTEKTTLLLTDMIQWTADAFETDFLKFKAEGHSDKDSVCKALAELLKDGFYVDRIIWMTEDTETVPYIYLTKIVSGAAEESVGIL